VLEDVRCHPDAGVGDAQAHVTARVEAGSGRCAVLVGQDVGGVDAQQAAPGHGVACVDGEIDQGVPELGGIGQYRVEVLGEGCAQTDMLSEGPAQKLLDLPDPVVEVHRRGNVNVLA
jgi:hypothetical protein